MTYQLDNAAGRFLESTEPGKAEQGLRGTYGELARGLWRTIGQLIVKSFPGRAGGSASRSEPYRPDWNSQAQRDLLRTQARRIL